MRPTILNPLFASVSSLPGIGPKLVKLLTRLLGGVEPMGARVIDALFHLPTGVLDRRLRPKLAEAPLNVLVMVEVTVERHRASSGKGPYRVYCSDETGDLTLAFFAPQTVWIERALPVGERRWVSGKIELFDGMRQMTHPDRIVDETDLRTLPLVEPVYPLTEGLYPRQIQKATQEALTKTPDLPEWQDVAWLKVCLCHVQDDARPPLDGSGRHREPHECAGGEIVAPVAPGEDLALRGQHSRRRQRQI